METIFQKNLYGILLFGFGVLVSLFPLHSWAPKSYSAAPTSAAMLHAGVLKKFGLYGLIQIAAPLLPEGVSHWATLLGWLALGNIVIIGLATISQTDLKQMVSYSSVMHMGYAFLGIASLNSIGTGGAVMLMFGHGLSVALLFLLTTYIYHRTDTFDMNDMGGLATKAPVLGAFFIAATMAGIGLPGFANFWGEFTIFMGIWGNESIQWMLYPAALGIVISAIYGLRAVAKVFYGEASASLSKHWENNKISDITLGEKIPALILIIALLLVGFYPGFISKMINRDIEGFRPEVMVGSNSIELSNIEKLNTDKIYQSQFVSLEHK
jgi:NADH-quinone oxidoreductase subunit M